MTSRSKTLVKLKDEFKDKYPEWASKTLEVVGSEEDGRHLIVIDQNYYQFTVASSYFELVKPATPVFAEGSSLKPIYEQWLGKNKEKSFAQQIAEEEVENMSRDNIVNKTGSSSCDPPNLNKKIPNGYKWSNNDSFHSYQEYLDVGWTNEQLIKFGLLIPTEVYSSPRHKSDDSLDNVSKILNNKEETDMSNKTNRRVLNIQLLDNDAGLPVEHALVAEFNGVVTEDNDQTTLQEIISTGEVAERIKVHNEVRSKQLDLAILKSTGQKVNLLPIKLKDLTWNIK